MSFVLPEYRHPDFAALGLDQAPDVTLVPAPADGVMPDDYHATTMFPEYFRINGRWELARDSRMDCVAVVREDGLAVVEFRNVRKGDLVAVGRREDGSQGIYVYPNGFEEEGEESETFSFRQGRSRETAYTRDYDQLCQLLRYERDHGNILWVMGPACTFDAGARRAFSRLVREGYVQGLMAGNALATHDLEGAYFHTALGQDIETQENRPLGHYHHLDTINSVRLHGSIGRFIEEEQVDNGIMYALEKTGVPYVLAGSIRDDGPLPCVCGNAYEAQDAMRAHLRKATTVVCMATMLHTIATGNMTPSYRVLADGTVRQVYFYCVDIAEFAVNKLIDRGSLASRGIVTNVQDFIANVAKGLGL